MHACRTVVNVKLNRQTDELTETDRDRQRLTKLHYSKILWLRLSSGNVFSCSMSVNVDHLCNKLLYPRKKKINSINKRTLWLWHVLGGRLRVFHVPARAHPHTRPLYDRYSSLRYGLPTYGMQCRKTGEYDCVFHFQSWYILAGKHVGEHLADTCFFAEILPDKISSGCDVRGTGVGVWIEVNSVRVCFGRNT